MQGQGAYSDAPKRARAICNLLLAGCHAAAKPPAPPRRCSLPYSPRGLDLCVREAAQTVPSHAPGHGPHIKVPQTAQVICDLALWLPSIRQELKEHAHQLLPPPPAKLRAVPTPCDEQRLLLTASMTGSTALVLKLTMQAVQAKEGQEPAEEADQPVPPPPAKGCLQCLASAWRHAEPATRAEHAAGLASALAACLALGAPSANLHCERQAQDAGWRGAARPHVPQQPGGQLHTWHACGVDWGAAAALSTLCIQACSRYTISGLRPGALTPIQ